MIRQWVSWKIKKPASREALKRDGSISICYYIVFLNIYFAENWRIYNSMAIPVASFIDFLYEVWHNIDFYIAHEVDR